ncbi:MAG: hypothetical protein AAF581_07515 [Planctomycetota bacterium]
MYYHSRELRYVRYGKVEPPPIATLDDDWQRAYQWLGRHCGYFPQVWLARSHSAITGFRSQRDKRWERDQILFGFDQVQGFPVDYQLWCWLLTPLWNSKSLDAADAAMAEMLAECAADPDLDSEPAVATWMATRDLAAVLARHLFIENDQVVVPNINLKAAKRVICRNERQKAALRKLGFIEDRILIKNIKRDSW